MSRKEMYFCDFCGADLETEYAKFVLPAEPTIILPARYPKGDSAVPFVVHPSFHEMAGQPVLTARVYDCCPECTKVFQAYIADTLPNVRRRLTEGELREFAARMPGVYRGMLKKGE